MKGSVIVCFEFYLGPMDHFLTQKVTVTTAEFMLNVRIEDFVNSSVYY